MKNFDLFKLLGGIAEFYKNQQAGKDGAVFEQNQAPTSQKNATTPNFLDLFLRKPWQTEPAISENKTAVQDSASIRDKKGNRAQIDAQKNQDFLCPLQSQMLTTMRSHDEFLKRVKNTQKKRDF